MARLGLKRKGKPAPQAKHKAASLVPRAPSRPAHKFTTRQKKFIDHYVILGNATQAAKKAGYSQSTAGQGGLQLLRNTYVKAEIDRRLSALAEKHEITADWVIEELAKLARANILDYLTIQADGSPIVDFSDITREQGAALKGVTVEEFKDGRSDKREVRRIKFTLADKEKALELLGRRFKLFAEQHEHDHTHRGVIGLLLAEIDAESRGKTIEHDPSR